MKEKIKTKVSLNYECAEFYITTFGFARSGANYIIKAFPYLFEKTLKEIEQEFNCCDFFKKAEQKSDLSVKFDGSSLSQILPEEAADITENLSYFRRVVLEYYYLNSLGSFKDGKFVFKEKSKHSLKVVPVQEATRDHRINLLLTKKAAEFAKMFSPEFKSTGIGASFILQFFYKCFINTINSQPAEILDSATEKLAYQSINIEVPQMLGWIYNQHCRSENIKISVFEGACMEIYSMSAEKRLKTENARPRLTKITSDFYKEKFGCLNAGLDFATNMMPILYSAFLERKIVSQFTQEEIFGIKKKAEEVGVQLAHSAHAGETISWLADRLDEPLRNKIKELSPAEKVSMEVYIHSEL